MSAQNLIFHIDVNSAFLSWEASRRIRENPEETDLRTIPSAIGGNEKLRHGVVLAKSVPAKKFGIQTGEPLVSARRKCPELVVVPPDFSLYVQSSSAFMQFLAQFAPEVDPYSIDEAFCDMSGTQALYGDPVIFAEKLREDIFKQFGFTVNIGISTNRLLAKMASDFEKPNRVHTLFPDEIQSKMWPLPVGALFSVGKSTQKKLSDLGIQTIGDIARCDRTLLVSQFKKHGDVIWHYANGIDLGTVTKNHVQSKSFGNSITLHYDVTDTDTAKSILLSLCETVAARIRADKSHIGVVSVFLTDCDFNQQSKQCTLTAPTNITECIYDAACGLFDAMWDHTPIRLLGVSASHPTSDSSQQLSLFDSKQDERRQKLNCAIDEIRSKFGEDSIKRARFIGSDYNHMAGGLSKISHHKQRDN